MTVTRDYLLKKPSRPPPIKVLFDTSVVPFAVNVAGGLEVALDRLAVRMGWRPRYVVGGIAALAAFAALRTVRSQGRRRGRSW